MDSGRDEITTEDLARHTQKHGQKATSKLLSILGGKRPLYDIVMSPGGQLLFSRTLNRMNELLDMIVAEKATEKDLMEYRLKVEFLNDSVNMLKNYKKHKDMLKGVK